MLGLKAFVLSAQTHLMVEVTGPNYIRCQDPYEETTNVDPRFGRVFRSLCKDEEPFLWASNIRIHWRPGNWLKSATEVNIYFQNDGKERFVALLS